MPSALEWTAMLGLVAAASGCGTRTSPSKETQDPDHPCYQQGNCSYYRQLPDGGVAAEDETDAGTLTMCGPCNG